MERCLNCGADQLSIYVSNLLDGAEKQTNKTIGISIYRCDACGLFNYIPRPTIDELRAYHDATYFICEDPTKQTSYSNYVDPDHHYVKQTWGRWIITWFYRFDKQRDLPAKKIIDVGGATGFMLEGMKTFDRIDVVAAICVDISEWATRWGRENVPGIDFRCGRLPAVDLSDVAPIDYFCFWDSLNHDPDPNEVLQTAYKLMRPGGVMIIHTIDGNLAKPDWYYWSPHQHTCIFPKETLLDTLRKCGFSPNKERLSSEPDELILIATKE